MALHGRAHVAGAEGHCGESRLMLHLKISRYGDALQADVVQRDQTTTCRQKVTVNRCRVSSISGVRKTCTTTSEPTGSIGHNGLNEDAQVVVAHGVLSHYHHTCGSVQGQRTQKAERQVKRRRRRSRDSFVGDPGSPIDPRTFGRRGAGRGFGSAPQRTGRGAYTGAAALTAGAGTADEDRRSAYSFCSYLGSVRSCCLMRASIRAVTSSHSLFRDPS
ncbi:hypothetical protein EYF80_054531 [Liparis tanakae]|uniref:Uncharacterized protein n=1 Tax=Liparis tanakae TaxID=230148 RepID=A0A4Z2F3P7_9TELE|nr:hypothetical protein EYF80_054531 [Liparis tanakae]